MQELVMPDTDKIAAWVKREAEKIIMSGRGGKIVLDIAEAGADVRGSVTQAEHVLPLKRGAGRPGKP